MKTFFRNQYLRANSNDFIKNIFQIFKGSFLAKLILSIGSILLAKLYGPEDFGVFNVFLSVTSILAIIYPLSVDHLVILSNSYKKIIFNLNGVLFFILFFTSISLLILGFAYLFNIQFAISYSIISIAIISAFSIAFVSVSNKFFSKINLYRFISKLIIIDALFSVLFQFLFYYLNLENGLIYGSFLGFFLAFLATFYLDFRFLKFPNLIKFQSEINKNIDLLKYTFSSDLLNALGNYIMPILMISYFAQNLIGEYSLALKIIGIPILLISSSISTVYYPKASQLFQNNKSKLFQLTYRLSLTNFGTALLFLVIINTIGVYVLNEFYGEKWSNLSTYMLIISYWFLGRSLVNPISNIIILMKKNYYSLIFNIYLVIANLVAFYIGVASKSFEYVLMVLSFLIGTAYFVLFFIIYKRLNRLKINEENN